MCDAIRFGPPTINAPDLQNPAKALLVAFENNGAAESTGHILGSLGLGKTGLLLVGVLAALSTALAATDMEPALVGQGESSFYAGVARRDNDALARPLFRQAADVFAELRLGGADSPELHRNEGNALLLSGDLPRAILAYHRGLRLNPDDAELRQALNYARSRVEFPTTEDRSALAARAESLHWAKYALRRWGLWFIAGLAAAGWMATVRWRVTREGAWGWAGGAILALAVVVIAGRIEEFRIRQKESSAAFAVVRRSSMLRKGDGPSFAPRRDDPLPAGSELTIRQERGNWLQVELSDGSLGWLPREMVAME
jgi:tetratricopeptide (TPR) repeat protein